MPRNPVWVRPAFLATREKLQDRFIYVGKIAKEGDPDNFMFYLIEILSPWHPSTKVEEVIVKALTREYSGKEKYELEDFEESLKVVNEKLGELSQAGDNDWIGNLNATVGLVEDGNLHISVCGNILGYLIRKGKISSITEGLSAEEDHPLKTFVNITSGSVSENDRVVIGNINFFDFLSIDRLKKLTSEASAKEAIFEIHRALRKSKTRETSSIILDVVPDDYKETDKEKELAEMLFLDQAPDMGISKFMKKATPVARSGLHGVGTGFAKFFNFSVRTGKSAHKKWKENYGPKTAKALKKGATNAGAGIAKLSGRIRNNSQVKYMGVKVKPYSKKPSGKASKIFETITDFFVRMFEQKNRRYLYVALAIVLVFIGYMKIRANNANRVSLNNEKEITQSYTQAVDLFNKAKDDLALNKSEARDELGQALEFAIKAQSSPATKDDAVKLAISIEDKIDGLIAATRFRNPSPIYSIKSGVERSVLVGTTIYSVTNEGKIYSTEVNDKSPKLIASIASDSGKVISTAFSDSLNTVYLYTDKNIVYALDVNNDSVGKPTLADGASWETSVALSAYVSNLYLLDSVNGKIWKHVASNSSFGAGSSYSTTKDVSVKDSVDLAIDGNVYVLKSDATVAKFVRGVYEKEFSLKALPSPLEKISAPAQIATDSDTNYLYILDKGQNRIIRFDKTGAFSNQYFFDGITIDQFFINPRVQKMWVASGSNFYEISI